MGIKFILTSELFFLLGLYLSPLVFGLGIALGPLAYQKLWAWLNRRLGRQSKLLLSPKDSFDSESLGDYIGVYVWLGGLLIGAWTSRNHLIRPENLADLFSNASQLLLRTMIGGFLSLCLGEFCSYLYERETIIRLQKYLSTVPIIQKISRALRALVVLITPFARRINRCLDSLNTLTERIVRRVPAHLAFIVVLVVIIFGCSFLYANVYAVDAADSQQGQARASDLLAALQTYKSATGKYPATLEDLVPQYILHIPRPARRYEYKYLTCWQGAGYLLYYRLQGTAGTYCGYGDKLFAWQCVPISTARFQNSSCDVPK
ncbi:MAG TPA: hypothetical protein PKZ84_15635 [Anaerolineae bacterium]|nr:hypothetical protein [Anaerolineae bacterium]HQI85180.1 hypothetical protein [Anaerolineae bacterium]